MSIKSFVFLTSLFVVLSGANSNVQADYSSPGSVAGDEIEEFDSRNQMGPILFDQEQIPHLSKNEIESRLEGPSQKMKELFESQNMKVEEFLNQSALKAEDTHSSKVMIEDLTSLNLATKLGFSSNLFANETEINRVTKGFSDELFLEQAQHTLDNLIQGTSYAEPVVLNYVTTEDITVMKFYEKARFSYPLRAQIDTGFRDQTFLGKLGEALERAAQSIETTNPYAPYYAWGP